MKKVDPWTILRIGFAIVLLWFGIHKLIDPAFWSGYAAAWATALLPISLALFFRIAGVIEILVGLAILSGKYTRIGATAACIWLVLVILNLFTNGGWDIAVRDIGLFAAALALALKK